MESKEAVQGTIHMDLRDTKALMVTKRQTKRQSKQPQGKSSPAKDLSSFLRRKPLPISISTTRQLLKKKTKKRWQGEWKSSPRFTYAKQIDNSLPSDDYPHIIKQLQHNRASILIQFRTGYIPLNSILHRIKRVDTLDCPHYAGARRNLHAQTGQRSSLIPFLLGSRKGIPHLLHYVSNTNRLKATFGEVCPADDFVIKEKEIKERPTIQTNRGAK